MRNRLIELLLSKSCMTNRCPDVDCEKCECIAVHVGDADKIADYLLANGVIVPPCKVGDVVWLIGNMKMYTKEEICSRKIISVQKLRTGEIIMHFKDGCFAEHAIGVYVFLTREEAEAKLKEGAE